MTTAIPLPQTLIKRLEKLSASSRLTPQSIVKQAVTDRLDYEEWLLARVDAGIENADAGRTYSREVMLKKLGMSSGRKKTA